MVKIKNGGCMKIFKTLFATMTLVFALTTFAQDTSTLTLKENMKQINSLLKQITASINDVAKNQINAENASKISGFFQAVRKLTPDTVNQTNIANYQALIDQEIQNFKDLEVAFTANDNANALSIVQKINLVKKEGHDKYK
jgi:gas vesicle protein